MPRGDPLFIFRLCPVVVALLGLDAREARALLARCGLPDNAVLGACTAPLSRFRQLLDEASRRHRGAFSIALAHAAPEGTYETAELIVRTAPTIRQGLGSLARYGALINPVGCFEVRERGGELELHYFVPGSPDTLGAPLNEFTIAFVARALRRVATGPLPLCRAWFSHKRSGHAAALEGELGCAVRLGAPTCGFAMERAHADAPLRTSDAVVFGYLTRQAEQRLEALGRRSFTAVVVDAIENRVGLAEADLARVARALGATARTVQRRLEDEGTSFRDVVDGVRRRHAESMLASGMSSARIAETLGFADVRSFRRAFARWTDDAAKAAPTS